MFIGSIQRQDLCHHISLQRVDIIVNLQCAIARVLRHLLLGISEIFSHLGLIDAILEFDNNLTDVHGLHLCHRWLVGTKDPAAKPGAQSLSQLHTRLMAYLLVLML